MAFTVYTSNRMEKLAVQLGEILARPLSSPLTTEVIVVQSKGMQRWLSMELARRYGVWANCSYPFPNAFLQDIFSRTMSATPTTAPFEPAQLLWRIMRLLDTFIDRHEFAEIRGYLTGVNTGLKRYQLAGKIADTFDQYTVFRGDLLTAWETGADDQWQAILWRALVAESAGWHRGKVQAEFLRRLADGAVDNSRLPRRISVFGISYLPAFHLQVLAGLAACTEVNLFVMSPCREYWGDILPGQVTARMSAAAREKVDEGNALLASLGRLGRDFSELLLDCADPSGGEQNLYQAAAAESLLAMLQNDILTLRQPEAGITRNVPAGDGTIRLHSCHSAMREVEVLHDNLLQMFAADRDLQPRDILVMTPDIETYAAYIAAVFAGSDNPAQRIPFTIADRTLSSDGKLADTLIALLDLAGQRFTAPAVMAILAVPAVAAKFGLQETDLDLIKTWLDECAIRWGWDEYDREKAGLQPYREQSWRAGLDRLLLGYAMATDGGRMCAGILPYDTMEGNAPLLLGRLITFVTALQLAVNRLAGVQPLAAWEELLHSLIADFFAPAEDEARAAIAISRVISGLGALQMASGFTAGLELSVVRAWLQSRFAAEEQGLGFLAGGVTFCAMLPMRSIPFKVIALIGMNDGLFPRQSRPPGFDLIGRSPRTGDRSLRNEDRYLFLEAMLSARQQLYISYCGQSIRDNSAVPPSTLVSELLDYLQRNFAQQEGPLASLITRHRLQPFSQDYFNGSPGLFSFSRENFTAVSSRLTTERTERQFIASGLPAAPETMRDVSLGALLSFYSNPAAYLLRHRLAIVLKELAAPLAERETFATAGLDAYGLKQELLEREVAGDSSTDLFAVALARGLVPPAPYGELIFKRLVTPAQVLAARVQASCAGAVTLAPLDFELHLDSFRLSGRLDGIVPEYLLRYRSAKAGGKDKVRLWIEHLLLNSLDVAGYPRASRLITVDGTVTLQPCSSGPYYLQQLLELYWQGLHRPLKFFPSASLAYAKSGKRENAVKIWQDGRFPESADRSYSLCFGESDPLDDEFARISATVFAAYLHHKGKE